jgi:microcystin-dependent protein
MEPVGLGFVAIGAVMVWPLGAAPSGWHICDGANISRTRYSALFDLLGTTFGVGDGSTTFGIPLQAGPGSMFYIIFTGLGS